HGHRLQLEAIQSIHRLKRDMAISVEMVERDQQEALNHYLTGRLSTEDFVAALKTRKRSAAFFEHYKPIFDYASIYQIPVIAANVPRPLAKRVGKDGLEAVQNEKYMPQETSAPKDAYWEAFKKAFSDEGHGSNFSEEQLYRYYQAQCVKDDAMAESIAHYLKQCHQLGRSTVVVHLCGAFHSDHGWGTVAHLRERVPSIEIGIVSTKTSSRVQKPATKPGLADFLWVVKAAGKKSISKPASKPASRPTSRAVGEDEPDARPGFNFMPVYQEDREEPGVEIDVVSPDGAAEKAGLRAGDIVLKIDDHLLMDLSTYMKVLGGYRPGDKVTLTVVRGDKSMKIEATVGESRR
ncbi:MAG: ChaN family lipoprotein, partial [Planctomycetota bacterium]